MNFDRALDKTVSEAQFDAEIAYYIVETLNHGATI